MATKAYTRTGDNGFTSVFGRRLSKSDFCFEVIGDIDELNSAIGVCRTHTADKKINNYLQQVQINLFKAGAFLAGNQKLRIALSDLKKLERTTNSIHAQLPALNKFILPDGSELAAHLHLARAVCRRTERRIVMLAEMIPIPSDMRKYFNRLSSLLFVLARWANKTAKVKETEWTP